MILLTTLPIDLWKEIVNKLGGTSLTRLWLSGDRIIQLIMSQRGVLTSAIFTDVSSPISPSRFPGAIGSFQNLTSLQIVSHENRIGNPDRIWAAISKLNNMKSLFLAFPESEDWMFDWELSLDSLFDSQPLQTSTTRCLSGIRPIATTFPLLESITLKSLNGPGRLRNSDLQHFPASILVLDLSDCKLLDFMVFNYIKHMTALHTIHLPSSSRFRNSRFFSSIRPPSSITSLRIDAFPLKSNLNFWNCLPSLTCLTSRFAPDKLEELPSSIQHLEIESWINPINQPTPSFKHLARLKSLRIGSEVTDNTQNPSPDLGLLSCASLETIRFKFGKSFSEDIAHHFPPSLTDINIYTKNRLDSRLLSSAHFPHLTSLQCYCKEFDVEDLAGIPSSLTVLELTESSPTVNGKKDRLYSLIPRGLTSLYLNLGIPPSISSFKSLPRCMRKLVTSISPNDVQALTMTEYAECFKDLPQSLEYLHLKVSTASTPRGNRFHSGDVQEDSSSCLLLPVLEGISHLPYLNQLLLNRFDSTWDAKCTSLLPPSLHTLHLYEASISSSFMANLPPSLTKLSQMLGSGGDHGQIDGSFIPHLPPGLRSLNLTQPLEITADQLKLLPKALVSLDGNITLSGISAQEAVLLLPRSCQIVLSPNTSIGQAFHALTCTIRSMPLEDPDPRTIGRSLVLPKRWKKSLAWSSSAPSSSPGNTSSSQLSTQ